MAFGAGEEDAVIDGVTELDRKLQRPVDEGCTFGNSANTILHNGECNLCLVGGHLVGSNLLCEHIGDLDEDDVRRGRVGCTQIGSRSLAIRFWEHPLQRDRAIDDNHLSRSSRSKVRLSVV